jgi:hypothetical protein
MRGRRDKAISLSFGNGVVPWAYGKAMQPIQGTVDHGISQQLAELFRGNEGNTLGAEVKRRAALPPPKPPLTWPMAGASGSSAIGSTITAVQARLWPRFDPKHAP